MNISGSKFESRNVLDRIEDTGKELMKPEVRATLTHGVAFMLVGKI